MPWVRIDDVFYDNLRNRELGPAGRDLFLAGLCYCAKGLTDGRIPRSDLPLLLAQAQAKRPVMQRLIDAGRWVAHDDYIEVAEYLSYQPSKAKVLADRDAAAARQRARRGRSHAVTHEGSHTHPGPARTPLLDTSLDLHPLAARPSEPLIEEVGGQDVDFEHHEPAKMAPEARHLALATIPELKRNGPSVSRVDPSHGA